jgi:hypothetical protein
MAYESWRDEELEFRGGRIGWDGRNEYADCRGETGWEYEETRRHEINDDRWDPALEEEEWND